MKRSKIVQLTLFLVSVITLLLSTTRVFAEQDPVSMLQGVTGKVMQNLKQNKEQYRNNPGKLYEMVNHLVLPHADFEEMSRWVVGKNAWNAADTATQKAFEKELRNLVIRSYARSLFNYTHQIVDFLPMRESAAEKQRVQISSIIKDEGRRLKLDYRLIRTNGDWKVYDIIIEGVSLMQGYRAQFADDVRHDGVKGALSKLRRGQKR